MSIYATMGSFGVVFTYPDSVKSMVTILIQGVPAHINYTGPEWEWLPPPVLPIDPDTKDVDENGDPDYDYPDTMRAIVFVEATNKKGTERCSQEYQNPLLILNHVEYITMPFPEVMDKVYEQLNKKIGSGKYGQ